MFCWRCDRSGKTDIVCYSGGRDWTLDTPQFEPVDLVKTNRSPLRCRDRFRYAYSTLSSNTQLPFNLYLVSSVATTADIGAPRFTKTFTYADGYYNLAKREFRGFGHVKLTEPSTADAGVTKDYFFHQGATFGLPSAAEGLVGNLRDFIISDDVGNPLLRFMWITSWGGSPPILRSPNSDRYLHIWRPLSV